MERHQFLPCRCAVWVPGGSWAPVQWAASCLGLSRHHGGQQREVSAEEEVATERGEEEGGARDGRREAPTLRQTKPLQRKMKASGLFPCQPLPGCDFRWHKGERGVGEDSGPKIGGDRPSPRCQTQCPLQETSQPGVLTSQSDFFGKKWDQIHIHSPPALLFSPSFIHSSGKQPPSHQHTPAWVGGQVTLSTCLLSPAPSPPSRLPDAPLC